MASHIPTVLSLLGTAASAYPALATAFGGSQPSQPPPPPPQSAPYAPPAAPVQHPSSAPAPSAPVNVPGSFSSQSNNAGISTSPPSNYSNPLCDFCHSRPKFSDGSKLHPYCGKTCASKNKLKNWTPAMGNQPPQMTVPGANCDFCLARPKHFDGTKTHPFCSKACAKNANGLTNAAGTCQAPNCQNPVYTNTNGSLGEYCSMAHKTLGETLCIMCLQAPKTTLSHFCSQTCIDNAEKGTPAVLEVPVGHVTFKSGA
ncbi:hypothetical protein P691DRAFT_622549, partial [Macrolepiota fuliginosa MF-IS2]